MLKTLVILLQGINVTVVFTVSGVDGVAIESGGVGGGHSEILSVGCQGYGWCRQWVPALEEGVDVGKVHRISEAVVLYYGDEISKRGREALYIRL